MDEFSFIRSITPKSYKQNSVIKGIGDDAAVFRQAGMDIVTSVDTFVDGVHFSKHTMNATHIGYRALAANLSDLAAMGAVPAFYFVSVVIPKTWSNADISAIFAGMRELATHYQMDLMGGDTVSGKELTLSITVVGFVEKDKARYRNDAKTGDIVFVTGTLGDSQAGFHIIGHPQKKYKDANYYIQRHRTPFPQVSLARELRAIKRVALNDISDGIASEANEIAEASMVDIHLFESSIPVYPSFDQFSKDQQKKWKYYGGEDFELVGAVAPSDWKIVEEAAKKTNTLVTKIGCVSSAHETANVFLHSKNNQINRLKKDGYTHLK
ncbi:thiamine-phosphate kinase [Virgibacillus sp. LDC-1]|uniref:thiamine-phosphate kinase n=1 Tax=Virgibacillus sp. LDC-1 TaxID=3039856 RepID=UPI0024DE7E7F|nr:thiamine-phosphate kinase [Virgibacillus sp. LDC-1]